MDEAMTDGRHIARYLIIAFAMTWTCWMARAALCASGVATVDSPAVLPLFLIGGFGPTVAALVVRPDTRSLHGLSAVARGPPSDGFSCSSCLGRSPSQETPPVSTQRFPRSRFR